MSRTASLSLLRQCTAAIQSPAAAGTVQRSAFAARAFPLRSRSRQYSTQGEQNGSEENKVENGTKASNGESQSKDENGAAQSDNPALAECTKNLKAKEGEVTDLTSRLRYLQADFLNLQRNAAREKEQTRDFAISRFAGDLLETVDVLSLALRSVPEAALKPSADDVLAAASLTASDSSSSPTPSNSDSSPSSSASSSSSASPEKTPTSTKSATEYLRELHHGVEMTHRLLLQTLFKYNVKPFDPTGDSFDPNRHEALYQAPIPGKKPGTVIDCQKTGYTIKDRTLRAAQVGVAAESS